MNDKSPVLALEQLQSLATAPPPTTAAAVRAMLGAIEAALAAGASHGQIHAALAEGGYTASLGTFRNALYRARKRAAATGDRKRTTAAAAPRATVPASGRARTEAMAGPTAVEAGKNPMEARRRQLAEDAARRAQWDTPHGVPEERIVRPGQPYQLTFTKKPTQSTED